MKKIILLTLVAIINSSGNAEPTRALETKNGIALLQDTPCTTGNGLEATIPSYKNFPKVILLGCYEFRQDGYIALSWNKSIGADLTTLNIHMEETIKAPPDWLPQKNDAIIKQRCSDSFLAVGFIGEARKSCKLQPYNEAFENQLKACRTILSSETYNKLISEGKSTFFRRQNESKKDDLCKWTEGAFDNMLVDP